VRAADEPLRSSISAVAPGLHSAVLSWFAPGEAFSGKFGDADDRYAPDRLSTLLEAGEGSSAQRASDNQYLCDEGANQVVRTAFAVTANQRKLDKVSFVAGCDAYADFDPGMLKPMVRTDFMRSANITYREVARQSEDFLYLVEFFAAGGESILLPRP
jgi:succinoglycan biosynthesis protein ExoO